MHIPERAPSRRRGAYHLAFSASEVFAGVAVSDWPLPYAVLMYRLSVFVIFVVQPVFQVITAELPSSFQVPVIPSPRVAFADPPFDSVISNGCPAVSFTFHTPSNVLWATAAKLVTPKKQAAITITAFFIFVPPTKYTLPLLLPFFRSHCDTETGSSCHSTRARSRL